MLREDTRECYHLDDDESGATLLSGDEVYVRLVVRYAETLDLALSETKQGETASDGKLGNTRNHSDELQDLFL
jgi:hypothetical protein